MKSSRKVLIIGGGPSGLTAAYHCGKKNIPALCFEAENILGGLSRTVEYRGFYFDVGGHRFFTKIKPVQTLWTEILGNDFLKKKRLSRIYYYGRFFKYPLQPFDALAGLGLFRSFRILASYLFALLFPAKPENNFEKWISNRFGAYLYSIFFKTYTEKVWGIPCDKIQGEWAAQRIKGLSLWNALLNSLYKSGNSIKSLITEFHYPRLGPGQMYETMAEKAAGMGSKIHRNIRVLSIHHCEGKITSLTVEDTTSNETNNIQGTDFISTMPLPLLVRQLNPLPPEEVLQAANALRFRSIITINLLIDTPQKLPDNWLYIHDHTVQVGRIQFFANWSRDMVPSSDKSSVGMEYFCWENDQLWNMPDDDLIELGKSEIRKLEIVDPKHVFDGFVVRMPTSYPVYDENFQQNIAILKNYLMGFKNLHPCGRNGLFKYNNMDHSILTAMFAVENIQGAHHDLWSVNSDFEYHEESAMLPSK